MDPIDYFWQRAAKNPSSLSLEDANTKYQGQALFNAVQALSLFLIERGVKPQDHIGVVCGKTFSQVVSLLSLWNIRAVYVPLSLQNPKARFNFILNDCDARYILAEEGTPLSDAEFQHARILRIPADYLRSKSRETPVPAAREIYPHDACYIMYTSGSTGQPKGVVIENKSLASLIEAARGAFSELDGDNLFLQVFEFSFDVSIWDVVLWIVKGGTLLVIDIGQNIFKLIKIIAERRPTYLCNAAPTYSLFLSAEHLLKDMDFNSVKTVITTASECSPKVASYLVRTFREARVYNCYGPTETTVYCCWTRIDPQTIDPGKPQSIGYPLPNHQVFFYDGIRLIPAAAIAEGVEMELCIGGVQVMRGYWKSEALTQEKILRAEGSERVYRTGDLVTRQGLEFIYRGRVDDTIKIRGFRVNLGEIEICVNGAPFVSQCSVVSTGTADNISLVAFYARANAPLATSDEADLLVARCRERLPFYMIPKRFVRLDIFPYNASGKIDRFKLRDLAVLK